MSGPRYGFILGAGGATDRAGEAALQKTYA
jgi:hypothetical protein